MHWLLFLGLLWASIYAASLLTALFVRALLPISPFVAAIAGLFVGLIGVLYLVGTYADRRLRTTVGDLLRRERPTLGVGREEDLGGIVEELKESEQRRSTAEDRSK
jgi:hypothetical protein